MRAKMCARAMYKQHKFGRCVLARHMPAGTFVPVRTLRVDFDFCGRRLCVGMLRRATCLCRRSRSFGLAKTRSSELCQVALLSVSIFIAKRLLHEELHTRQFTHGGRAKRGRRPWQEQSQTNKATHILSQIPDCTGESPIWRQKRHSPNRRFSRGIGSRSSKTSSPNRSMLWGGATFHGCDFPNLEVMKRLPNPDQAVGLHPVGGVRLSIQSPTSTSHPCNSVVLS